MKKSAFTLIELSIVLVIIGLLIGGSFKILKVMRGRAQITRAQDDVQVAKQAVIGNTILNTNRLPPASYFQTNLSPVKNNQHPLLYTDDSALEGTDICSFTTTNMSIVTPTNTILNVAFVVASEAANHNMQTAKISNQVKTYNYATKVDDNTSPINIVENYDDIVDWVTLSQLQQELRCQDHKFKIINRTLPVATQGIQYSAKLYVENNVGAATINCNPTNQNNINFLNTKFQGTPTNAGTFEFDCNATENVYTSPTRHFVLTVDSNGS